MAKNEPHDSHRGDQNVIPWGPGPEDPEVKEKEYHKRHNRNHPIPRGSLWVENWLKYEKCEENQPDVRSPAVITICGNKAHQKLHKLF